MLAPMSRLLASGGQSIKGLASASVLPVNIQDWFPLGWTARRSNQSILKETSPEYSLEGLMLKLKLQYFGHLMWRTVSFEKILILEMIEDGRRMGRQRMRWMASLAQWTWIWVSFGSWWWTRKPGMLLNVVAKCHTRLKLNWTGIFSPFAYCNSS